MPDKRSMPKKHINQQDGNMDSTNGGQVRGCSLSLPQPRLNPSPCDACSDQPASGSSYTPRMEEPPSRWPLYFGGGESWAEEPAKAPLPHSCWSVFCAVCPGFPKGTSQKPPLISLQNPNRQPWGEKLDIERRTIERGPKMWSPSFGRELI